MDHHADYDRIAETYDRRYRNNDYSGVEQALLLFVGTEEPGRRVLEVGCGTGHWLELLSCRGFRVAGLDASAEMLARARARVPAPNIELVHGSAERLPWPDRSFDRLVCINALHHFDDKLAFLAEARRVLRPGGSMLSVGLDPHTGIDAWYVYDYFAGTLDLDLARYPATAELREWMGAAGFAGVATREVQRFSGRFAARDAEGQGRLERTATSQLSLLTEEEYRRGLDRIRAESERVEARGETLHLNADLRLYGTSGSMPA